MPDKQLGLFFGAGAELDYGMPLGGRFALDIFRQNVDEDKQALRQQLENVDRTKHYGTWLPDRDRIWSFGKREASDLLESTIQHRKDDILGFFSEFEDHAEDFLENWNIERADYENAVSTITGRDLGGFQFSDVALNEAFQDGGIEGMELFESHHFSSLLAVVDETENGDLRAVVMAFVELFIACHGENIVRNLNLSVFEETRGLDFLEDLPRMFRFELESVARDTLGLVFDADIDAVEPDDDMAVLEAFGLGMLERLLGMCFDYRSLVDEHFRYLFTPSAHWAKFTRVATFLFTVRRYMAERQPDEETIENGPGFYHDLPELENSGFEIHAIGTSNYNTFLGEIIERSSVNPQCLEHLNGGLQDFYDPYLNKISAFDSIDDLAQQDHVLVPFMLTQSGTKPMTSVKMSKRYVELYDRYAECDCVVVVGYGFNTDDSHINGTFRSLVEEGVEIIAFDYDEDGQLSARKKREARNNLRIERDDDVTWCGIDVDRDSNGGPWWERVAQEL